MGQLHKDRAAPARRAQSVLNILAHIEFGTSFVLMLCLLFQVIVKITRVAVKGGGFIAVGGEQF